MSGQSVQSAMEYSDESQSLQKTLHNFIPGITTEKCKYDVNEILLIKYSLFCTALHIDFFFNSLMFCKIASEIDILHGQYSACMPWNLNFGNGDFGETVIVKLVLLFHSESQKWSHLLK